MPSADRLFALSPAWRNLTENAYFIQTAHRLLSFALSIGALGVFAAALLRGWQLGAPVLLFGLLTVDGALGAATLFLAELPALSIAHQVCGVLVVAATLALSAEPTPMPMGTARRFFARVAWLAGKKKGRPTGHPSEDRPSDPGRNQTAH